MTISHFERLFDRVVPALLLVMGSSLAAAFATVAG
jgi:hypothetical protein